MGGPGSTRWWFHKKKTQVEACLKLDLAKFKDMLIPGYIGSVAWSQGNRVTASIGYFVIGEKNPQKICLVYSITNPFTEDKQDYEYSVNLQTTMLSWGARRYWFTCQLTVNGSACGRRVRVLYLPPDKQFFGCRHCYDLTYRSSQESHRFDSHYAKPALTLQDRYPGFSSKDVKDLLQGRQPEYRLGWLDNSLRELEEYDFYGQYLTIEKLCQRSGLSSEDVKRLENARLLLPDRPDGRYRPKLVSWGRKLHYLLNEGWKVEEVKRWASGRFQTADPRQWPPDRDRWK